MRSVLHTLRPETYHGQRRPGPFFEGWYYKCVTADQRRALALIPGIFRGPDPASTEAFIQVVDTERERIAYHRFPEAAFHGSAQHLDVAVGPNRFTDRGVVLELDDGTGRLSGSLHFPDPRPWPVTLLNPGIMGWYAWMPFMECYHGVVSLDHGIDGCLTVDGETIDFTGGRGYIEKDWGRSFPAAWVWLQCNHFAAAGTSLTASLAIIPWIGRAFPGFIVGLWHDGHLHRFTTYSAGRIETLELHDRPLRWTLRNRTHRLAIEMTPGRTIALRAPAADGMTRHIDESLSAAVRIRLSRLSGETLLDEDGAVAGFEAVGDLDRLRAMWIREKGT